MNRAAAIIAPLVLIAALLGGWEAAVRLTHTPAYVLPAPSAVGTPCPWP
jgi:NitT/TauT family transport system permease protein